MVFEGLYSLHVFPFVWKKIITNNFGFFIIHFYNIKLNIPTLTNEQLLPYYQNGWRSWKLFHFFCINVHIFSYGPNLTKEWGFYIYCNIVSNIGGGGGEGGWWVLMEVSVVIFSMVLSYIPLLFLIFVILLDFIVPQYRCWCSWSPPCLWFSWSLLCFWSFWSFAYLWFFYTFCMFVILFSPCLVSDLLGLHYVHDILGPHYVHNQMLKFGTPLECLSSLIPNLLFMFVIFIFLLCLWYVLQMLWHSSSIVKFKLFIILFIMISWLSSFDVCVCDPFGPCREHPNLSSPHCVYELFGCHHTCVFIWS